MPGDGIQDQLINPGQHILAVQLKCPRARAPFALGTGKSGSMCSTKIPLCAFVLMGHSQLLQQGKMSYICNGHLVGSTGLPLCSEAEPGGLPLCCD